MVRRKWELEDLAQSPGMRNSTQSVKNQQSVNDTAIGTMAWREACLTNALTIGLGEEFRGDKVRASSSVVETTDGTLPDNVVAVQACVEK